MSQNQIKNSTVPIAENEISLFDKLIAFGKAYDLGFYSQHSFEIVIHEFLVGDLGEDGRVFLTKILPFLQKLGYLEENATIEDVLNLLKRHDSWADLDSFDDLFSDAIQSLEKIKTTSLLGDETKTELLKTFERQRDQINKNLDFLGAFPMPGVGNAAFHKLVLGIAKLAFEDSTESKE